MIEGDRQTPGTVAVKVFTQNLCTYIEIGVGIQSTLKTLELVVVVAPVHLHCTAIHIADTSDIYILTQGLEGGLIGAIALSSTSDAQSPRVGQRLPTKFHLRLL